MAVRQITPVEKVVKCHVNTLDGSPVYESGVAYEAGTLVIYNDMPYVSVVPIEDSDTDTPDAAPSKWSITPDAFTASASESGLANRVSALEEEVSELQTTANIKIVDIDKTVAAGKTLVEACTDLMDDLLTYCRAMEDGYVFEPLLVNVPFYATGSIISMHTGGGVFTNNTISANARLDLSELRASFSETNISIYVARIGSTDQTNKTIQTYVTSTGVGTDLSSTVLTASCDLKIKGLLYKKL